MTKQVYIIKKCSLLNIKQFYDILLKTWPSHAKNVVNYHNPWRWWVYEWTVLRESRSSYAAVIRSDGMGWNWYRLLMARSYLADSCVRTNYSVTPYTTKVEASIFILSRSCWSLDLVLWKLHQLSCFPFFLVATFPAF